MIPNNCGLELIGVADREQMNETAKQQMPKVGSMYPVNAFIQIATKMSVQQGPSFKKDRGSLVSSKGNLT